MNKFPAHPGLKRSKEVDSDLLERCNRLVLSEVLCPWRESCQNNQYPWEANLELRARWRELMAAPGDYTKQIAGFVGLARCTLLTAEEYRAINDFYVGSLSQQLHGNLVMNYFLSGGSPPVALLVGYYGPMLSGTGLPMLSGTGLPPPGFWHYFSRLVRHPFFAQIAEQLGAIDLPGPFMSFLTRANPAFTAPDSAVVPDNSWGRALDRFRALKELALTEPIHAFEDSLAMLLRTDLEPAEIDWLAAKVPANELLSTLEIEHPVFHQGKSPEFDPKNPNRDAISYFEMGNGLCELWRYYNPLLRFPWEGDSIFELGSQAELFAGLAFFGMPIIDFPWSSAREHPDLMDALSRAIADFSFCDVFYQESRRVAFLEGEPDCISWLHYFPEDAVICVGQDAMYARLPEIIPKLKVKGRKIVLGVDRDEKHGQFVVPIEKRFGPILQAFREQGASRIDLWICPRIDGCPDKDTNDFLKANGTGETPEKYFQVLHPTSSGMRLSELFGLSLCRDVANEKHKNFSRNWCEVGKPAKKNFR